MYKLHTILNIKCPCTGISKIEHYTYGIWSCVLRLRVTEFLLNHPFIHITLPCLSSAQFSSAGLILSMWPSVQQEGERERNKTHKYTSHMPHTLKLIQKLDVFLLCTVYCAVCNGSKYGIWIFWVLRYRIFFSEDDNNRIWRVRSTLNMYVDVCLYL